MSMVFLPDRIRKPPGTPRQPIALMLALTLLASTPSLGLLHAETVATKPASAASAPTPRVNDSSTKPRWSDLAQPQREALLPLASHWDGLSAAQKRKWIALSKNFDKLPAAEQKLLRARMSDWVALSPQQRRAARLNFAETSRMSSDEKQQKWQAYQELTPDARIKFSEVAPPPATGAAIAVRPVPRQKLTNVPATATPDSTAAARPKLAAPNQIDPRTLLPQRHPAAGSGDRPK